MDVFAVIMSFEGKWTVSDRIMCNPQLDISDIGQLLAEYKSAYNIDTDMPAPMAVGFTVINSPCYQGYGVALISSHVHWSIANMLHVLNHRDGVGAIYLKHSATRPIIVYDRLFINPNAAYNIAKSIWAIRDELARAYEGSTSRLPIGYAWYSDVSHRWRRLMDECAELYRI
jgi:hypothetical protein